MLPKQMLPTKGGTGTLTGSSSQLDYVSLLELAIIIYSELMVWFLLGDPWRDATVSADNITVPSTASQPIFEGDGYHCSDLITVSGEVDPTIARVQAAGLASMKAWLLEWTSCAEKQSS